LDIWKGRCWERAGIVIEKLIGRRIKEVQNISLLLF